MFCCFVTGQRFNPMVFYNNNYDNMSPQQQQQQQQDGQKTFNKNNFTKRNFYANPQQMGGNGGGGAPNDGSGSYQQGQRGNYAGNNPRTYQNRFQGNRFNGYPPQQRGSENGSPSSASTPNEHHPGSPLAVYDNMNAVYTGTPPPQQLYQMQRPQPYMLDVGGNYYIH